MANDDESVLTTYLTEKIGSGQSAHWRSAIHRPLPAQHPFYANIGLVASEWSHLEHILDLVIWRLMGGNDALVACITAQIMGVAPRCKAIITLGKLRDLPDMLLKKYKTLMSDSYVIADIRARIIHDPWYIETATNIPGQFKSMPYFDPKYGIRDIAEGDITLALEKIRALKKRAADLRSAVLDRFDTSEKKHP